MDQQTLLIPASPIFSFRECHWFLDRDYDDCMHTIRGESVLKAIRTPFGDILFGVSGDGEFLKTTILNGPVTPDARNFLADYVADWFDVRRDIGPFYELLRADSRVAYMAEAFRGLRLVGISDMFEAICWSIIGQQINLTFAYKLKRRMVERYGTHIGWGGEVFPVFPAPEVLAGANIEELRAMQFSQKKAEYVVGIARAFAEGKLCPELIAALPDFESRQKALTAYKGVGIWTANYVLMKTFRMPEGIPHGDVGLLNALTGHGIIGERSEKDKIEAFFNAFPGWETYLTFYLWRSLAVKRLP
ncbi:DNA repair protein [Dyadobacter sp. 676]|uniref:DNA-3-methyladenine glycosylase II n=1 Tax=Dyadobacter sp. 676 TaxID=3088362 RepID=A0AAU8FKJ8_9BACT